MIPDFLKKQMKLFTTEQYMDIPALMQGAKVGDEIAQSDLAARYIEGKGVSQDAKKAYYWLEKAAKQGNAIAQYNLGAMYYAGQGVEQDFTEAYRWFHKAAEQGDVVSQNNLGVMYRDGTGVEQNDAEAFRWYMKAAEQGYTVAQYRVGEAYRKGCGVSPDREKALHYYELACNAGHTEACTMYAQFLQEKKGWRTILRDFISVLRKETFPGWYRRHPIIRYERKRLDSMRARSLMEESISCMS